jgi:hypothetical protein
MLDKYLRLVANIGADIEDNVPWQKSFQNLMHKSTLSFFRWAHSGSGENVL